MKICVYTCLTGDYDNLDEVRNPEENVDYYCFTNNPKLKSKTWKIVQIKDETLDNSRLSRKVKLAGDPTLNKYDVAVYTDANIVWQKPVSQFVKTYHKPGFFTISKHHCRNSVKEEAAACILENKDSKESIKKALDYLEEQGFPDNIGLFECTVFIREPSSTTTQEFGNLWFETLKKYSKRDQISFPFAAWKIQLPINAIDLNVWNNEWFTNKSHCSPNPYSFRRFYFGDLGKGFDPDLFLCENNQENPDTITITVRIPKATNCIEFIPTATIGTTISDFSVKTPHTSIEEFGFFRNGADLITCARRSTLKIHGDFKKGEKLELSLRLTIPEMDSLSPLVEKLWAKADEVTGKFTAIENENRNLKMSLDKIHSTVIWKIWTIFKRPLARFHKYPKK